MNEIEERDIVQKLRLTNRLLAQVLIKDANNQTERIVMLERCGFSPSDIADLLKIKLNVVTATLSGVRKAAAKKQKSKAP